MGKETDIKSRVADSIEINALTWKPLKAIILLEFNPWISIFIKKRLQSLLTRIKSSGSLRRTTHHKH